MANVTKNPSASASVVAGWTSIDQVYASDDSRAIASATSAVMVAKGFGFAIPPATINGILITCEYQGAGNNANRRALTLQLTKDGTSGVGTATAVTLAAANSDQVRTAGGAANLLGTTWTREEINSADFGVLLKPSNVTGYERRVDHVYVTVYYTEGSSSSSSSCRSSSSSSSSSCKSSSSSCLSSSSSSSSSTASLCFDTVIEDVRLRSSSSSSSSSSSRSSSSSSQSSSSCRSSSSSSSSCKSSSSSNSSSSSCLSSSSSSSSQSSSSSSRSSSSQSITVEGPVVWGHYNFAIEPSRKSFGLWETLLNVEVIGPWADIEQLKFLRPSEEGSPCRAESDLHYLGVMEAVIQIDHYLSGQGVRPTIYYKTGATAVDCLADSWHAYNGVSFTSLGWIKLELVRE